MSDIPREDEQNFAAFQRIVPKLKVLRGKYFLMRHGKIINFYDTLDDAHSTGVAVYDDRSFSVCLLRGAKKKTAKKEPVKKAASKKKPTMKMATLAKNKKTQILRKTDVPGYNPNYPDQGPTQFEDAAKALRIRPFYNGPNSRPFECLGATQVWTTSYQSGKARTGLHNDFRLSEACHQI
jgi:hypothetical protein